MKYSGFAVRSQMTMALAGKLSQGTCNRERPLVNYGRTPHLRWWRFTECAYMGALCINNWKKGPSKCTYECRSVGMYSGKAMAMCSCNMILCYFMFDSLTLLAVVALALLLQSCQIVLEWLLSFLCCEPSQSTASKKQQSQTSHCYCGLWCLVFQSFQ